MPKITLAIVTYHNDFLLLYRLLKSIYQYWNPEEIHSIKILLNDHEIYQRKLELTIPTDPKFKVEFHRPVDTEVISTCYDWHSQQLYKCLIADLVETEWYILNDSKDFYVEPVSTSECFTPDNRAISHINHERWAQPGNFLVPGSHWTTAPFSLAFKHSYEIFGLNPDDYPTRRFAWLTPFIVHTQTMREMTTELKETLKGIFPHLFSIHLDGQPFVTEFLLYSAFCARKNNYSDYINWDYNHRVFYDKVHNSKDLRLRNPT